MWGESHTVTSDQQLLDAWATWQRASGLRPNTIRYRQHTLDRIAAGRPLDTLTADDIITALARPDWAPATRQVYRATLVAWHHWLQITDRRLDNPMVKVPKVRRPPRRRRHLTNEHIRHLMTVPMRRRTRALITLGAYGALRIGEAAQVRGQDIDRIGGALRIPDGKGGTDAVIPLADPVAELARDMPTTGWWFPAYTGPHPHILPTSASRTVSDAMKRHGVPGTAHSLRHWCATELHRQGVSILTIRDILRHADVSTTQLYIETGDEGAAAIMSLPVFPQPAPHERRHWHGGRKAS